MHVDGLQKIIQQLQSLATANDQHLTAPTDGGGVDESPDGRFEAYHFIVQVKCV
jgi:hypothetical protein